MSATYHNPCSMDERIATVLIAALLPAEENPRELTPAYRELLKASLQEFGWINPVIVNRLSGRILTGHQRCQVASEDLGWEYAPVSYVTIPAEKEAMAVVRLNDISGNWYFKNRDKMQNQHYAQMSRSSLGSAYKGWVLNDEPYNQSNAEHKELVKSALGDAVVDYGCGKMTEFKLLHKLKIETIGYDPYQKAPKENKGDRFKPTIEHTRNLARLFLANITRLVKADKRFSVVNQAVLSSIGFSDVRENVAAILAALTYLGGSYCYVSMLSTSSEPFENFLYGRVKNTTGKAKGGRSKPAAAPARQLYVPDESEENLFATGVGTNRQIFQKYFTPYDVEHLFDSLFTHYDMKSLRMVHVIRAENDVAPDSDYLRAAVTAQFENLEIDGEKLGLGDEALRVFTELIGITEARRGALLAAA